MTGNRPWTTTGSSVHLVGALGCPVRVVSWNLAKRSQHATAVLAHLDELRADLVLLQETRIHGVAEERGWSVVRAATSPSDCVVLARPPLRVRRAASSDLDRLGAYVAHAELVGDSGTVDVLSVHPLARRVPAEQLLDLGPIDVQRPSDPSVWWSDLFFHLVRQALSGRSAIIGGDWNTSRLFQESLFDRAAAAGWCEAVPHFSAGRQQRTWFRGSDRPHGLDHVFCTDDLRPHLTGAFVDASTADSTADHAGRGLSDHAPVVVDLDLPALRAASD